MALRLTATTASAQAPVLTEKDAIDRLKASASRVPNAAAGFYAFFSSVLGGVVKDPHLMVVPMDEHLVHRGHGVFDTATVKNGKAYQLDQHLDRLLRSAEGAEIDLQTHGWSRSKLLVGASGFVVQASFNESNVLVGKGVISSPG